jgi:hypothetical protein
MKIEAKNRLLAGVPQQQPKRPKVSGIQFAAAQRLREHAASWWDSLSREHQEEYVKEHPDSKYAQQYKAAQNDQGVKKEQAPQAPGTKPAPSVESPKNAPPSLPETPSAPKSVVPPAAPGAATPAGQATPPPPAVPAAPGAAAPVVPAAQPVKPVGALTQRLLARLGAKLQSMPPKEQEFYTSGGTEANSPARSKLGGFVKARTGEILAHLKNTGMEWKTATTSIKKMVSGQPLSAHERGAIKSVAQDIAVTIAGMALTGGLAHGLGLAVSHMSLHILRESALKAAAAGLLHADVNLIMAADDEDEEEDDTALPPDEDTENADDPTVQDPPAAAPVAPAAAPAAPMVPAIPAADPVAPVAPVAPAPVAEVPSVPGSDTDDVDTGTEDADREAAPEDTTNPDGIEDSDSPEVAPGTAPGTAPVVPTPGPIPGSLPVPAPAVDPTGMPMTPAEPLPGSQPAEDTDSSEVVPAVPAPVNDPALAPAGGQAAPEPAPVNPSAPAVPSQPVSEQPAPGTPAPVPGGGKPEPEPELEPEPTPSANIPDPAFSVGGGGSGSGALDADPAAAVPQDGQPVDPNATNLGDEGDDQFMTSLLDKYGDFVQKGDIPEDVWAQTAEQAGDKHAEDDRKIESSVRKSSGSMLALAFARQMKKAKRK